MSKAIDIDTPEWPHFAETRRETPAGMRIQFDTIANGQRYGMAKYLEGHVLETHRMGRTVLIEETRQELLWRIRETISGMTMEQLKRADGGTRPWIDPTKENR